MHLLKTPQPNMYMISNNWQVRRRAILNYAPRIGLSFLDYGSVARIDQFYIESQNFRDYYRDASNKLRRPETFMNCPTECGINAINMYNNDATINAMTAPPVYRREQPPLLQPLEEAKNMRIGERVQMTAQYDKAPCIRFKR